MNRYYQLFSILFLTFTFFFPCPYRISGEGLTNLLRANQARLEIFPISSTRYEIIGGAKVSLTDKNPDEGSFCMSVQPGGGSKSTYGVSTKVSCRENGKRTGEKTEGSNYFEPAYYTGSVYVRGLGYVQLGIFNDADEGDCKEFQIEPDKWQRIWLTTEMKEKFGEINLLVTASVFPGYQTEFFIDKVQIEKGEKATEFNAPVLPKELPATGQPDLSPL